MNVTFTLTYDGLTPKLQGIAASLDSRGRRSVLEQMGAELLEITLDNFGPGTNSGRPTEWAPLSPRYQRAIGYYGPPKLILGDRLRNNFRFERGGDFISLINDTPYASLQQHGGRGNYGPVPPRPYLPVTEGDDPQLTPYARRRIVSRAELALMRFVRDSLI